MDKFVEFISNNYVWFLTIALLLLFALIGFIYDSKKNKTIKQETEAEDNDTVELLEEENNKIEKDISNINIENVEVSTIENTMVPEVNKESMEEIKEEIRDEKPEMPAMKEDTERINNN